MRFRAVLFDLGYTLVDYRMDGPWREFLHTRLVEMCPTVCSLTGMSATAPGEFAEQMANLIRGERAQALEHSGHSWHLADRLREAFAASGVPCSENLVQKVTNELLDPVRSRLRPYSDTIPTLERLREAEIALAVISNSPWDAPGELSRVDMGRCGIADFFDVIIVSGDVPWRKPNPEFMWAAAEALGVEPCDCLVVGDSLMADIAGARAAGMSCVWVNRDGMAMSEDDPKPDEIVADLTALLRVVSPY